MATICPQRRVFSGSDIEQVEPLIPQKKILKDCASTRMSDTEVKRLMESDSKHGSCCAGLNFAQLVLLVASILLVGSASLIYGSGVLLIRANDFGRQCTQLKHLEQSRAYKFAMVTCSDGSNSVPKRSFEGLMELVTPNKKAYVGLHGYDFIDASDCLDKARPPSWSKILAVRKHLRNYDWVFWNDADSLVTNPSIALEDIIGSVVGDTAFEAMPDFIVTEDVTGVNAGMFFFKNTEWSYHFLDLWWNQTSFVKPFGQCKSGDNDALKYLIKTMDLSEKQQHVRIPSMQCLFNSNLWRPSWKTGHRLMTWTRSVWQGVYARGDFMVHLAGLGDKKTWIKKLLQEMENETTSAATARRFGRH